MTKTTQSIVRRIVKKTVLSMSVCFNQVIASICGRMRRLFDVKYRAKCTDAATTFGLAAGDCVLVLAPHPDDETAGMGGTISQLKDYGVKVHLVLLTDGAGSKAGVLASKNAEQRAEIRNKEYRTATSFLGGDFELLGPFAQEHPNWPDVSQLHQHLDLLKRQFSDKNISLIFTPPTIDFHPHHRATAVLAQNLATELLFKPKVICYEVQAPFRAFEPDFWVSLRTVDYKRKKAALEAYRSQSDSLKSVLRLYALRQRLLVAKNPVEVFTSIDKLKTQKPLNRGMLRTPFNDLPLLFRSKKAVL